MALNVSDSFNRTTAQPPFIGMIFADAAARDLFTVGLRYEGMIVTTLDDGKNWQLIGGTANGNWEPFSGAGGGGILSVADNTARDAIVSGDRTEGMIVFVVATKKNWQLQGGILNANWVNIDAAVYIGALQTFNTSDVAVLANALVQQIYVRGQVGGGTEFALPDPTINGQRLLITGAADDRTCILPTGFIGGSMLTNIAAPGDIEFSLFKTVEFVGDTAQNTWVQNGGW